MPGTKQKNEFEEDFLEIDMSRLEWEWSRQPGLFRYWSRKKAKADDAARAAKDNVELAMAKASFRVRSSPERYGIPKPTEASIKEAVIAQSSYREALAEYNRAKLNADTIGGVVTALEHKRRALEDMVKLLLAGFYSQPRAAGGELDEETQKRLRRIHRREAPDESPDRRKKKKE